MDSQWPKMTALSLIADFYFSAIVEFLFCEEINARISLVTNGSAGIGPLEAGKLNVQVWEFGTLLAEYQRRRGAERVRSGLHAHQ